MKRIFGIKKNDSNMSNESVDETRKSKEVGDDASDALPVEIPIDMSIDNSGPSLKGKEQESSEEDDPVESLLPSSYNRSSLFSRDQNTFQTLSTNPTSSSSGGGGSQGQGKQSNVIKIDNIGKPLRVLSTDRYNELSRVGTSTSQHSTNSSIPSSFNRRRRSDNDYNLSSGQVIPLPMNPGSNVNNQSSSSGGTGGLNILTQEIVSKELSILNENLLGLIDQLNQNVINISKATISIVEFLDDFLPFTNVSNQFNITTENNEQLRNIIKIILQLYDNYLRFEVYINSKNLLIKSFIEFLSRLQFKFPFNLFETIPFMKNFAITDEIELPNKFKIQQIMETISQSSSNIISDQEGSFIAPIMRGLTPKTSILAIMFGFPDPQQDHYEIINALFQSFPDVHFFLKKDYIKPCGITPKPSSSKFKPPFKTLSNKKKPEISLSISSENSIKTTGTLGGFIEPIFHSNTDKSLLKYKGSKFGITCAHVLLNESQDYPNVNVPSSVLVHAYMSALRDERDKYPENCMEYVSYNEELKKSENFSMDLGQVVWGERVLMPSSKKISDLSIIKCNSGLKCENILGDDLDYYNPSLKFKNLQIKKKIKTIDFNKHSKIFKMGASTKYTQGEINGIKLVYWLDGSLQTSEFVVNSENSNSNSNNSPIFANSGDSGSLILNNLYGEIGLGVIGMLHSFDGELKQFGLFTPVDDILDRLNQVTGIEWDFIYS
ncbi:hypothetical protein BN7_4603 [Wickerhamomyces ciferrii]|uniref:SPS-sensor serine protease component SSY5 n=1 Tax=Wickerhamomyces ciferrii (strain ATCC 14091 / BCRC 22168 / CBS 111 / JCM 3599 / NBRC 0793 / NRRL Y-1031 F-60-10) TaxID=1206466 RepID=K0KUB3_WICCF|nr:uncharacterized protein BN7_4603 [Wickerhamomyces ciferrii]CCH45024.1 hypothetical protein BN7_4603 [Wickerhamomyces ciferrii]